MPSRRGSSELAITCGAEPALERLRSLHTRGPRFPFTRYPVHGLGTAPISPRCPPIPIPIPAPAPAPDPAHRLAPGLPLELSPEYSLVGALRPLGSNPNPSGWAGPSSRTAVPSWLRPSVCTRDLEWTRWNTSSAWPQVSSTCQRRRTPQWRSTVRSACYCVRRRCACHVSVVPGPWLAAHRSRDSPLCGWLGPACPTLRPAAVVACRRPPQGRPDWFTRTAGQLRAVNDEAVKGQAVSQSTGPTELFVDP